MFGIGFSIITYIWLLQHLAVTHIKATWLIYLLLLLLDFAGYVVHLIDHKFNFFLNSHIIHHSSEEFNLFCALVAKCFCFVKMFVILLLPAALLGVPAEVIAIVAPLHLFAQFWYHTVHIGKMGFWRNNCNTIASQVHHAINNCT